MGYIMSEQEIIDTVLRDIRREEKDVIKCPDSCYNKLSPLEKIDLYHSSPKWRTHAERRQWALESYLEYPFIKDNKQYKFKGEFLYYNGIKITADLLTGSDEIISHAKKLLENEQNEDLEQALNAYCRVVYTIGNCCPVMKNPGGRKGNVGGLETCWHKLSEYLKTDIKYEYKSITELFTGDLKTNLRARTAENMFAIFPEEKTGQEIAIDLFFRDFYDDQFSLIEDRNPNEIKGIAEYTEFMISCTKLIVQRGVRICTGNTSGTFDKRSERILKKIFDEKINLRNI